MSSISITTPRTASGRARLATRAKALGRLVLAGLLAAHDVLSRHAEQRRAVAHLSALTDAQLRDLGVGRADIVSAVCVGRAREQRR